RSDHHVLHAENSGLHAQRSGREDLPSGCMERIRNGQRGRRLPRMQELRTSLQIRTTVVVKYAMIETVFRLCRKAVLYLRDTPGKQLPCLHEQIFSGQRTASGISHELFGKIQMSYFLAKFVK